MKKIRVPPLLLILLSVIMLTLTYDIEEVSAEYKFVDLDYLALHPEEFVNCKVMTEGIADKYVWIPELPGNIFLAAPCICEHIGIKVEVDPLPSLGSMIRVYGTVLYGGLLPDYYIKVESWESLQPPTWHIRLESCQDDDVSSNLGAITFDGVACNLPDDVHRLSGTYKAPYNPLSPVYTFVRWETEGCINVSSTTSNPTSVTLGTGLLRAIYRVEEWDIKITATLEVYQDVCEFGVRNDATEGFDPAYDMIDPPLPPIGVASYFWYPDNPATPVDLRRLTKSKIPPSSLMNWTYRVKPVALDGLVTISWNETMISMIPSEYGVYLQCPDGKTINEHLCGKVVDMRVDTQYSLTVESINVYEFVIYIASYDFELCLSSGWNLISFPFFPIDLDIIPIFYQLITWDGSGYVSIKDPEPCTAYWMLVLSDTCLTFENIVPVTSYERNLPKGWSMIGSIYPCQVNANCVFSGYYQLLTWDGTGYLMAPMIEPGKGYWVLVLEPIYIEVNTSCCAQYTSRSVFFDPFDVPVSEV